jgi:two-component system sensor histidine kinase VicK
MDSCTDVNGPSMLVIPNHPVTKTCIDMKNRGVKIRFITEITQDNLQYCKELMKIAEVRHLDEVKGNFGIGDKRVYHGGADTIKSGPPPQLIISTVKPFVEQQQYFFDMLWKKAIAAEQKLIEIEQGIEPQVIETVKDPIEIQKISNDIIKSAKKEILTIFSSAKAFYRQDKAGTIDLLKQTSAQNPNLKIRILTPISQIIKEEEEIQQQKKTTRSIRKGQEQQKRQLQERQKNFVDVDIRHIEPSMQTKVTVLIVDRRYSLTIELKEDSKDNSNEDIGFATYSNSKPTVLSYASIFESLWVQTELYQQIKDANEQLKVHHRMQKEFINIAAHELRNPIQPILSLIESIRKKENNTEQQELLDIVARNAKKLKQLTEDVLDVTRIESNSLQLNKEEFNLNDLVMHVIQDYKTQITTNNRIKLVYDEQYDKNNTRIVKADKYRINQVISNLVSNSVKFTKEEGGSISIKIKSYDDKAIKLSVEDTGKGIDPEILPRLFTKFSTKSDTGAGIGLGLFISKSIIEAHGGSIWAENNNDDKGATFCFSLPLSR